MWLMFKKCTLKLYRNAFLVKPITIIDFFRNHAALTLIITLQQQINKVHLIFTLEMINCNKWIHLWRDYHWDTCSECNHELPLEEEQRFGAAEGKFKGGDGEGRNRHRQPWCEHRGDNKGLPSHTSGLGFQIHCSLSDGNKCSCFHSVLTFGLKNEVKADFSLAAWEKQHVL